MEEGQGERRREKEGEGEGGRGRGGGGESLACNDSEVLETGLCPAGSTGAVPGANRQGSRDMVLDRKSREQRRGTFSF